MIPKPIAREDKYYSYLINGNGPLPKPITRKEIYLHHLCVSGFGSGGTVTPEMIQTAVDTYLTANPVTPGATKEQVNQISENAQAIEELKSEVDDIKDNPPNPDLVMKMDSETGNILYKFDWKSE